MAVFYGSDDRVKSAIFEWSTSLSTESDCNNNTIPDSCEIANGGDCNNNGLLDACNYAVGDFDLSNEVDASDLGFLLLFYGEENPPFGDLDGSGACDSADVGSQLLNFGLLE